MRGRKDLSGAKRCVGRHRTMPAHESDRAERAIESSERQYGQRECYEGLFDYEVECAEITAEEDRLRERFGGAW